VSRKRVKAALTGLAVVAAIGATGPKSAYAQAPTVADTAAVLDVVAAVLYAVEVRADSDMVTTTIRRWQISPGDSLTARLAAAARITTEPAPADVPCAMPGTPVGAPTAAITRVQLTFASADTAVVTLVSSCRPPAPTSVGTHFAQGESFRIVRQGGQWSIASRWYFIS